MLDAIGLGCSSSIKLLRGCAPKQESAFTELGLAPKHDRFIACFSPLQAKARRAAEEVKATSLPHPWIGSEQGSPDSHEDRRFRHFLDHNHPALDDEITTGQDLPARPAAFFPNEGGWQAFEPHFFLRFHAAALLHAFGREVDLAAFSEASTSPRLDWSFEQAEGRSETSTQATIGRSFPARQLSRRTILNPLPSQFKPYLFDLMVI